LTTFLTAMATAAVILSKTDQLARVRCYQSDDVDEKQRENALHDLISSNIRLAHKVAKDHFRRGLDFNDLLSQAVEGIIISAGKFDASKRASFTTYAKQWMRAKCQEYVQANAGILHCGSRTSKKLWSSLQKARRAIGPDATPQQIANHLKLDLDDVNACLRSMTSRGMSLDAPLSADGGTVANFVPDAALLQDTRLERTQNNENINVALQKFAATLNDRQKAVFVGRVVHDVLGHDQRCAKTFGVSKQRVGQIEKQLRVKLAAHFTRSFGQESVKAMLRACF